MQTRASKTSETSAFYPAIGCWRSIYLNLGPPVRMRVGALKTEAGYEYNSLTSRSERKFACQVNDRRSDGSPTEPAGQRIRVGKTSSSETAIPRKTHHHTSD